MSTRTVSVIRNVKEITCLDLKGEEVLLGHISMDSYGKDEVKRFDFKVSDHNPWAPLNKRDSGYSLGVGSAKLDFVNPADVQGLLINKGFETVAQYAARGGLQLYTVYQNPEVFQEDLFPHDNHLWDWRRLTGPDAIKSFQGMLVETDLRIGHMAVRLTPGLYRLICENGLFENVLDTGVVAVKHHEFDTAQVKEKIQELIKTPLQHGPAITTIKHLKQAHTLLKRYSTEIQKEKLSVQMQLLGTQFQGISKNVIRPWALEGYLTHLSALLEAYPDTFDISTLHLVNAYTSAVNIHRMKRSDKGILSALYALKPVVQTTITLANISAIFN